MAVGPLPPVGLIAGNGLLPQLFAQGAARAGREVVAVGHKNETLPALEGCVKTLHWVRVGQVGAIVRFLRRAGVAEAVMAGGIDKARMMATLRPDWAGFTLLWRMARRRDDAMLREVARYFEEAGIRIISSTEFMPQVLTPLGLLGQVKPTTAMSRDLNEGLRLARAIGALDVGQTVALKEGTVVALEALEGTDSCMLRAGLLCENRGVVVVKAAKPGQDMRFDVPTVGPETLRTAARAGVVALGLEAGRTLMVQPEHSVALANAAGIALVGLP